MQLHCYIVCSSDLYLVLQHFVKFYTLIIDIQLIYFINSFNEAPPLFDNKKLSAIEPFIHSLSLLQWKPYRLNPIVIYCPQSIASYSVFVA